MQGDAEITMSRCHGLRVYAVCVCNKVSCSIGDAVGINRHFKENNTDSHFSIYLGGTRSAQAQHIPVSMYVAETVQHSDSSQVNGL